MTSLRACQAGVCVCTHNSLSVEPADTFSWPQLPFPVPAVCPFADTAVPAVSVCATRIDNGA